MLINIDNTHKPLQGVILSLKKLLVKLEERESRVYDAVRIYVDIYTERKFNDARRYLDGYDIEKAYPYLNEIQSLCEALGLGVYDDYYYDVDVLKRHIRILSEYSENNKETSIFY